MQINHMADAGKRSHRHCRKAKKIVCYIFKNIYKITIVLITNDSIMQVVRMSHQKCFSSLKYISHDTYLSQSDHVFTTLDAYTTSHTEEKSIEICDVKHRFFGFLHSGPKCF
jgi:hypothetical protein